MLREERGKKKGELSENIMIIYVPYGPYYMVIVDDDYDTYSVQTTSVSFDTPMQARCQAPETKKKTKK